MPAWFTKRTRPVASIVEPVIDTCRGDASWCQAAPEFVERQTLPRSPATTMAWSSGNSAVKKLPL